MAARFSSRPTIGVLVTWPVYFGTSILWYQHSLLRGIYGAATAHECNLLIACGIDAIPTREAQLPAWPILSAATTFVPVGPWNSDGLIIAGMFLHPEQERYLGGLAAEGYPLVYTGFDGPGLSVNIDSVAGIRQALEHLRAHGHRRIAFIAGIDPPVGESGPRLRAYCELTRAMGLDTDPRLIAVGDLVVGGGQRAMRQILASGVQFTAVLASNDASGLGAAEVLRERGLRIPDDVAIIGFDDLLEAQAHVPPLTTVSNPALTMGRQAVRTMLEALAGDPSGIASIRIPVRLVVRRSCGCQDKVDGGPAVAPLATEAGPQGRLARSMAAAMAADARTRPGELEAMCRALVGSLVAGAQSEDPSAFEDALLEVLQRAEFLGENIQAWHAGIAALEEGLAELHPPFPAATRVFVEAALAWARRIVGEHVSRQAAHLLLRVENLAERLGMIATQLLQTLESDQIQRILAAHLPQLDVPHMLVALYVAAEDDPVAQAELVLSYGLDGATRGQRFSTRAFPPPELYPPDRPFQLALLPLVAEGLGTGFVAFDAATLEPGPVLVRSLATALRSSHLYAEALRGREQAEKADRLKTMLLTNVGHELRTPLNIILGYAQAVLSRAEHDALDPGMAQDIRQIARSGEHLLRLINDLLDLSRAEVDELHLLPELVDTHSFLEEVFQASMDSFGAGGAVEWRFEVAPELPALEVDPVRLRQILLNLLHNAHKFTPRGRITLGAERRAAELHIWVADTGVGIPAELQQQIFDPFVGSAAHGQYQTGLGIGLTITRRLVVLHRGSISVESQPGRGSTFHVNLPLPEPPAVPAPAVANASRVLLVISETSDVPPTLLALAEERGLVLKQLRPSTHPPDLSQGDSPALVAWDLATTASTSSQLIEQIHQHPQLAQLPIMLYHSEGATLSNPGALATGLLLKPIGEGALIEALGGLVAAESEGNILVVEDDAQTRAMHRRLIGACFPSYTIHEADNGRAALTFLAGETPSMIVLDLVMPEVDGFAVLEALRADPRTSAVPVLVLSGRLLSAEDLRRLSEARVVYQTKDVLSEGELAEALRRTLSGEDALPSSTSALVKKAIAFIHQHYSTALSRQAIADALGVSKSYLGQIFSQELGLSPLDYIIRFRVLRAKELLETTDESIADVATRVGFETATYFSRIFHREVGCSPRAFRAARAKR